MAKEYEVLEAGLAIAVNTASGISLGDLQKYAEQEFGRSFHPDETRVETRDHCVLIDNTNAYHPPSQEVLDQLLAFKFDMPR